MKFKDRQNEAVVIEGRVGSPWRRCDDEGSGGSPLSTVNASTTTRVELAQMQTAKMYQAGHLRFGHISPC